MSKFTELADAPLFLGKSTSIDDIEQAGFSVGGNGHHWWFRRRNEAGQEERIGMPLWIRQMIHEAHLVGSEEAKQAILASLGLKKPKAGSHERSEDAAL